MDNTKELELGQIQRATALEEPEMGHHSRLSKAAVAMQELGAQPELVANVALETIIDLLDFERGLIVQTPSSAADGLLPENVVPIATRKRPSGPDDDGWQEVRNPEFAVSHTVVSRALIADRLVIVTESLLQPDPEAETRHRTVLCLPFNLTDRDKGVLYLDRGLRLGEVEDEQLFALKDFVERCLHFVSNAFLMDEVSRLRVLQLSNGEQGRGGDDESEGDETPAADVGITSFHGIVGGDAKLRKLFQVIEKVKNNDLNICVVGESGTGKELLARAIHESGERRHKMFVAENCGAISETLLESELFGHVKGAFTGADEDHKGLFEVASGGTLFLDEIGDTSEGMQRKLLRVLQEGVIRPIGSKEMIKVDVRVISASNRDLKTLVEKGVFRADLYYRLNVITLTVPPLRERAADIPLLVQEFTREVCEEEGVTKRFSESALRAMEQYTWPGNIRELRNVVRRVLITSPRRVVARKEVAEFIKVRGPVAHSGENIERDEGQITLRIPSRDSFNEMIDECERVILSHALKECSWNKSKVTKVLRIPRQSLYNKIAKYDLQRTWGEGDD